ncbi:M20/M25/M40 family metallo-hydrolase [Alteromonadaceae bacterium M269]|nr:M20/M25/M40 family metallo-hydrolase [Alteromonadaceae bacterium M269]
MITIPSRIKTVLRAAVVCSLSTFTIPVVNADTMDAEEIKQLTKESLPEAFSFYHQFLSLPNDANYKKDILALLDWLEPEMAKSGFDTKRIATDGSPVLYAEMNNKADKTVLVYLQADGQPVAPSAWQQEHPFTPELKRQKGNGDWETIDWSNLSKRIDDNWRIFARSASDSKGPMTQFIFAIRALQKQKIDLDFNLKVIVDTEEELGSPNLAKAVKANRELLSADMLLIFDGPPHASNKPTLNFGARGIATVTLTMHGPVVPQHSGHYGNYVPNPAFALSHLLASMKSPEGKVLIDGYYDGINLSDALKQSLASVPDDAKALKTAMGFSKPDQVAGTLQESLQYPSLNIRGLSSAWVGDKVRTIIPDKAIAELDIRLVQETDPEQLLSLLKKHIESQGFVVIDSEPTAEQRRSDSRFVQFKSKVSYGAFRTDFDSEPGLLARKAMKRLHGQEPILVRTLGGSVPIAPFVEILDLPAVLVPTVNIDNNQHSPNENIRIGHFVEGLEIAIAVLNQPLH